MGPTLKCGPTAAEIAAITCPFQRAATVTQIARRYGTLPTSLYELRRSTLRELRALRNEAGRARYSAAMIATRVGLSRARIFQITRRHVAEESAL